MSFVYVLLFIGIMPMINLLNADKLGMENCLFILFYFTFIGFLSANAQSESNSFYYWVIILLHFLVSFFGLYFNQDKSKKITKKIK